MSSVCKHFKDRHNVPVPPNLLNNFHVLTKCKDKFECLVKEMLLIRKLKPALNVQSDSISTIVLYANLET